jgi:hemerythrin-like domain-containing protein
MAKHEAKRSRNNTHAPSDRRNGREERGGRSTIFDVLKHDHTRISHLIDQLEETSSEALRTREDLFRRLRDELDAHSRAEELVLYSRLKRTGPAHDLVMRSVEQHHVVTVLLGELDAMPKTHERWLAKLAVLADGVRTHVELEEDELFGATSGLIDRETAHTLGIEMARLKEGWLELERRSPTVAAALRGITQIAERLPFGGMIAAAVERPRPFVRLLSVVQSIVPRGPLPRLVFRTATWPITAPLARAISR